MHSSEVGAAPSCDLCCLLPLQRDSMLHLRLLTVLLLVEGSKVGTGGNILALTISSPFAWEVDVFVFASGGSLCRRFRSIGLKGFDEYAEDAMMIWGRFESAAGSVGAQPR
jgi:hypothetical protein